MACQFRILSTALCAVLFLTYQCISVSEEITLQAQEKLEELLTKSAAGSNGHPGLIEIAGSDFEKFITRGPRPYYLLVVLTAISSGNCQPCEQINPAIQALAKTVEEQRSKIDHSDASELWANPEQTDVFIINADFANNRNVFQRLGLSTAPSIVLVPPSKSRKEIPLARFFKSISNKFTYALSSGRSEQDIGNWIASTAKINWLQFGSQMELPKIQYIIGAILMLPALLYVGRKLIDRLRRSMWIYAVVCVAVYSFVIGGGMFSSIRNSPWLHKDGSKIGYIAHQSRYQFGVETYIIGGLNFMAGVAAFVFIMSQRSDQPQIKSHKFFSLFRFIPTFLSLGGVLVGWYFIVWCYNFKNGHYNYGHVGMKG
eukprot:CAMPEP_0202728066 /NCGR_PEP_ID=MMETSP1385-20130828/185440_1 /ASSEMBLY_ACC=CAM_ASM_000861 /TAXON_ID=933848 /ORGANISM="Elphidium margaritaceum" /LENGTH=370 /DNA_ID=CAMNT_0049394313 /DNA_START=1131 /DNA_END=2243 /DNA_ORIENTATION=+